MSEINVQLKDGAAVQVPASSSVADALKKLDRPVANQALAARVNGREVDLAYSIEAQENGNAVKIEPVLPQTLEGLDVLRHSTAHLLAAAVLDLFPGTKLGIGPALLDDRRQHWAAIKEPRHGHPRDHVQLRLDATSDRGPSA